MSDLSTKQRNDLLPCPFCNTAAIEQAKMAESDSGVRFRISCGNPFCQVVCRTEWQAGVSVAEEVWQERGAKA